MSALPFARSTLCAALLTSAAAFGQSVPAWFETVRFHGAADVYAAHNFNQPADHANFVSGTGTTAKRSDEIGLNLVSLEALADPAPVGFHVWLVAGTGAEVVHLAEPAGDSIGPQVWKHVQQASLSATIPIGRGLLVEGGISPSHIGFESLGSQSCWNYTRSWLGEFSPYYQTGVKAAYAFTDHVSAQVHLLNGWQTIGENNHSLAAGTQLALTWERFSVAFNTFAGPEGAPGDDAHWHFFGDVVATATITGWLSAGLAADLGLQQLPGRSEAIWHGVTGYLRFAIHPRLAVALRGEYFMDPAAVISGAGQTLAEGTATVELKPWDHLTLKLEGRYDSSTAPVFTDATGGKVRTQALVVLGAVASF